MLTTWLSGNVSDHMIRYAICRTVAEKNSYKYGINKVTSHDYFGGIEQMTFFKDINYGKENHMQYGEVLSDTDNIWEEKRELHDGYNFHPFQPDVFDVTPNTHITIFCGQDASYLEKEKCAKWFAIKDDVAKESELLLKNAGIKLDDDTCLISARGGEYRGIPSLFLTHNYWDKAMDLMSQRNPKMKFICLTEDPEFYKTFFNIPVLHFSCQTDWWAINNCKNAIVANSGFNIFPIWLNRNSPYVIAPYLWANHNYGTKEAWANSNMRSWGCFNFMDRDGNIVE
jgi:hypothetical protein